MSSCSFLLLCIQAFLIQNAYSQLYNSGFGFNNVNVDAVSYGSSLNNYGLSNGQGFGRNTAALGGIGANFGSIGATNFGGRGVALGGIGATGFGGQGVALGGFGAGYAPDVAAIASLPVTGPYGGTGYGELAVAGELGAAGSTIVTGQIPVLGAVSFGGNIPAAGVVSIAGNCGCGSVSL